MHRNQLDRRQPLAFERNYAGYIVLAADIVNTHLMDSL